MRDKKGRFVKGHHIGKGRKFTEEHKRKLREARKRQVITEETKTKLRQTALKKIADGKRWGRNKSGWKMSSEEAKRMAESRTGIPCSEERRKAISDARQGNFREGFRKEDATESAERKRPEYREWVKKVFERDKHLCQRCGKKGRHAHHIKNYRDYPELRLDIDNGKTLCVVCHTVEHHKLQGKKRFGK